MTERLREDGDWKRIRFGRIRFGRSLSTASIGAWIALCLAGCSGGSSGSGGGGGGAPVPVVINAPILTFDYVAPADPFRVGIPITPLVPMTTGGSPIFFEVSPFLPAGLALNPFSGVISGTPTAVTPPTSFVVTASNSGNSLDTSIDLEVLPAAPTARFSIPTSSGAEGTSIAIEVTLSSPVAAPLDVAFSLAGDALLGVDATVPASPLTIPPGTTSATLNLFLIDDPDLEPTETIEFTLIASTGNLVDPTAATHVLSIRDNDGPPTLSFLTPSVTALESSGAVPIFLSLQPASPVPVTVEWSVTGSAQLGSDYTITGGTVMILSQQTISPFPLFLVDDALFEGDETVTVTLLPTSSAVIAAPASATVTILDDEATLTAEFLPVAQIAMETAGTITATVALSGISGLDLQIPLAIGGSATPGLDYILPPLLLDIPANSSTGEIAIELLPDFLSEGSETITLEIQPGFGYSPGPNAEHVVTLTDVAPGTCTTTYPSLVVTFEAGVPIAPYTPFFSCGPSTTWTVVPPLPPGLNFDPATGELTGTPTTAVTSSQHLVTATSPTGSGAATLAITVTPHFLFEILDVAATYDLTTGESTFPVTVIASEPGISGVGTVFSGLSFAARSAPLFCAPASFTIGTDLQLLNSGAGPDFTSIDLLPHGFTFGCVFSFTADLGVHAATPIELVVIEYETNAATFMGNGVGATTEIEIDDTVGTPPVATTIVVSGQSVFPTTESATVQLTP